MLSHEYTEFVTEVGRKLVIKDQPIVLTVKQKQSVNDTIIHKESSSDLKKQQSYLPVLVTLIQKHNRAINQKYMNSIQSAFTDFPEMQNEIKVMALNGYALIGYRGVTKDDFVKYYSNNLVSFQQDKKSPYTDLEGFYMATSPEDAIGYAERAVKDEFVKNQGRKELKTPIAQDEKNPTFEEINAFFAYEEAAKYFYHTKECKEEVRVMLCFVEDFFSLRGKTIGKGCKFLTEFGQHDYFEREMMGWEIVLAHEPDIYQKIKIRLLSHIEITEKNLPYVPNGSKKMIELAYERSDNTVSDGNQIFERRP